MNTNLKRSLLFTISSLLAACSASTLKENKGAKIGEIGGEPLYFNEVWDEYQKSNSATQDSVTLEGFTEFAGLYSDFKTKLRAAKDAGYFQNKDITNELTSYEEQYALPYWLEKDIEKRLLDELEERSNIELEVSHMLISLRGNESPADTLAAWNKLLDARNQVISGAVFDSVSMKVSSTRDGRSMGGYLGWMSAGWAVKPFEDAAYTTPIDSISLPFRTQFGFHILTVKGKRNRSWDRMISHVYWRTGADPRIQDSVITLANTLRSKILTGEVSWDSVVRKYTQDNLSVNKAGSIGWVGYGRYNPVFNDSVFSLKSKGDISNGFYSGYGVHLLKLDSIKTFPDSETKRKELLSTLKNLPRYKNNKEATYARIRSITKAKRLDEQVHAFTKFLAEDTSKTKTFSTLALPKELATKPVFTIRNRTFTVSDYVAYLTKNHATQSIKSYSYTWFPQFVDECTAKELVPVTKEQFDEFRKTTEDYMNGLVVFKITEDSVWNYVKTDTTQLVAMYNKAPEKYFYDTRYSFWRISTQKDSTILAIKDSLAKGLPIDTVKNQFKGVFMVQDVISDITDEPFYRLGSIKPGETTEIFDYKKRKTTLFLAEILEPRQMNFDEAYFRVVADYQPIRETKWMESLRNRYKKTLLNDVIATEFTRKNAL